LDPSSSPSASPIAANILRWLANLGDGTTTGGSTVRKRRVERRMIAHQSQLARVRTKLDRDGFVTRNECLRQHPAITRLAARIDDLEKEGFVFDERRDHRDTDTR
jgi:hypothetical protein